MVSYVRAVWKCRYFWLSLVRMDLRTRYRGSVLGLGWSLLQPLAMTAILCAVFHSLFDQDIRFFVPYLMAGLAFWSFLLSVTVGGCQCFHQGQSYIRQFPAPMAIYPLRTVLGSAFHLIVALFLVVLLAAFLRGLPHPLALLALLPATLLILILAWGLALLFGLANVRFRDTHHLTELAMQGLFYLTPVMYPPELLAHRRLGTLLYFNPLMPFLRLLRLPILDGEVPDLSVWATALGLVALVFLAASLAIRQEERKLIFHL
jgi:lipopolysaccharide transport system permease protein